jgi:hypothetical protein
VLGDEQTVFEARVRFLHLVERSLSGASADDPGWQEAIAREFDIAGIELPDVLRGPLLRSFAFPAGTETLDGVVRRQVALTGEVRLSAAPVGERAFRVTLEIANLTSFEDGPSVRGDQILRHSLASTHALLGVQRGEFVSLVDPPVALREAAAACRQEGAWPVLVGHQDRRDMLLVSPIILEDYPRIAGESAGDLFDATEIDEVLTLRILTLTDAEKQAMRGTDDRARRLLERTESLTAEQLLVLHGRMTARDVGSGSPDACITIPGTEESFHPGQRVRLQPRGGADAFDIILRGKLATIQSLEQDFEGQVHLCVTIDEDPGRDLGATGQPGHRFFFRPEEVDRVEDSPELPR